MNKIFSWLDENTSSLVSIEQLDKYSVPEKPGVYIMTSDKTEYSYPWSEERGTSQVFYIGRHKKNIRTRIMNHKKFINQVKNDPRHNYYYPVYEYAAYHGCKICWATFNSEQEAVEAELDLISDFASYYGARPVANGQSSWC